MPLRRFDDRDFDSFVRTKFEAAPPANFDTKAWGKLNAKRGGYKVKLWVTGAVALVLLIVSLIWFRPFGITQGEHAQYTAETGVPGDKDPDLNSSESGSLVSDDRGDQKLDQEVSNDIKQTKNQTNLAEEDTDVSHQGSEAAAAQLKSNVISEEQKAKENENSKVIAKTSAKLKVKDDIPANIVYDDNRSNLVVEKKDSNNGSDVPKGINEIEEKVDALSIEEEDKRRSKKVDDSKAVTASSPKLKVNITANIVHDDNSGGLTIEKNNSNSISNSRKGTNDAEDMVGVGELSGGSKPNLTGESSDNNQVLIDKSSLTDGSADREVYLLTPIEINAKEKLFLFELSEVVIEFDSSTMKNPNAVYLDKTVVKEETKISDRFIIGLLVNTDLSTVKFSDFTSPGIGLGVRLTYRLSNRIAINAGITKTQRVYNVSDPADYLLPQWILARQGWPEGVEAKCNITEIPIGFRYDLFGGKNWNFYGQVSSSTFLMDREIYDFRLSDSQNQPGAISSWEVEDVNKHVFGVVGATLGYEKYFTRRFGLGIEVYWQTTINGIGIYSVDLNSLGNQVLLNYRF